MTRPGNAREHCARPGLIAPAAKRRGFKSFRRMPDDAPGVPRLYPYAYSFSDALAVPPVPRRGRLFSLHRGGGPSSPVAPASTFLPPGRRTCERRCALPPFRRGDARLSISVPPEGGVVSGDPLAPKCEGREGYCRGSGLCVAMSGVRGFIASNTAGQSGHTVAANPDKGMGLRLTAVGPLRRPAAHHHYFEHGIDCFAERSPVVAHAHSLQVVTPACTPPRVRPGVAESLPKPLPVFVVSNTRSEPCTETGRRESIR